MAEDKKKIKLFAFSDGAGVHTGFGTVNTHLFKRLLDTGDYEIHQLAINWYGDPIETQKWDNFYMYPVRQNPYGFDRLLPLLLKVQPDVFYTLNDYDAWGMIPDILMAYKQKTGKKLNWLGWFPVDGEPMYPEWSQFLQRFVDKPVVVSKYGKEVIKKADELFDVDQVYHGVDTKNFYPLDEDKIAEIKKGIGDKFVVGMVGVNQLRKQYPIAMEAFSRFAKDKDDVLLFLHTQRNMDVGWNLDKLARLFRISQKVAFTDGINGPMGIPVSELNLIYNVFDVFLHTATAEGFGIPLVEAMLTGTPVIYHNTSSMTELVEDAGVKIPTDHYTIFPNRDRELVRPIPSVNYIVDALEKMYSDSKHRKEMAKKSLNRALELAKSPEFNWDKIANYFDGQFKKLAEGEEELELEEIL